MNQTAVASVIVRTYNSMATLEQALASVRAQDLPCEVIVVDSGSDDGTVQRAEQLADIVVHIPKAEFSFGRALNLGAAASTTGTHIALSSHCAFPRTDWVRIANSHLEAGALAACGSLIDGEKRPITQPQRADSAYLRCHPFWGFTNHASAWRADVWRRWPFDESLGASEDKEWSWRIAEQSAGHLVMDPVLFVPAFHRRHKGVRPYYDRISKEVSSYHRILGLPDYTVRDAWRDWSSGTPSDPFVLKGSRPFGRTRLVEVMARLRAPSARGGR